MTDELVDSFGRVHDYLRISVTDRCNLRCVYCMPPGGVDLSDRDHLLTYEELLRVARVGVKLGVEKIRVTGGEPLVRRDVPRFLGMLSELPGLQTLAMTTNGLLLEDHLDDLIDTDLQRLNVSLDSLDPDRFERVTRGGDLASVRRAIDRSLEAGFTVKINVVALHDMTAREVERFADFARSRDVDVRFIEFMPLCGDGWSKDRFRSLEDLRKRVVERFDLRPLGREGVGRKYGFPGGSGRIGFIASLTAPFCEDCSRIRLSSTGELYPCLFAGEGVSLREDLRAGASDDRLARRFRETLEGKWEGNPVYTGDWNPEREDAPESFGLIRSIGG